jgi:hypothetical protein
MGEPPVTGRKILQPAGFFQVVPWFSNKTNSIQNPVVKARLINAAVVKVLEHGILDAT